jgi:mannose-6-phosphate isomerase-like protein (cupin superfamily)
MFWNALIRTCIRPTRWIFDVVVSCEAYLELDDGAEVLLKAGDCVIQNGTRHAWHNRSSVKCLIAVTLLGAERKP